MYRTYPSPCHPLLLHHGLPINELGTPYKCPLRRRGSRVSTTSRRVGRVPIGSNAIVNATRTAHIIGRQDPRARVIIALGDILHRHAPTCSAPMLQQRIHQWPNIPQRQCAVIALREHTDPTRVQGASHGEGPGGGLPAVGLLRAGAGEGDGLFARDADDVVAAVVDGGVGEGGFPDGVAEDLVDGVAVGVFPAGEVAETGAAAIDAEGGGGRGVEKWKKQGGEGEEGGMHCWVGWC